MKILNYRRFTHFSHRSHEFYQGISAQRGNSLAKLIGAFAAFEMGFAGACSECRFLIRAEGIERNWEGDVRGELLVTYRCALCRLHFILG